MDKAKERETWFFEWRSANEYEFELRIREWALEKQFFVKKNPRNIVVVFAAHFYCALHNAELPEAGFH